LQQETIYDLSYFRDLLDPASNLRIFFPREVTPYFIDIHQVDNHSFTEV